LNCANALASDPIFPACESYDNGPSDYHATALRRGTNTYPNPFTSTQEANFLADLPTLSKDLTNKFAALRRVTALYPDGISKQDNEKNVRIHSSDEVYLIERGLLTLANLSGHRSIITGCAIAGIIFIDNHMRGIDFLARLMGRLVARLQLTMGLVLTDQPALVAPIPTRWAIFWILCVGAIASGSRSEKTYFFTNLVELCDILSIEQWEDAKDVLKKFLWPTAWDINGALLWKLVEETRLGANVAEAGQT
jgi:hypothetical protein